MTEETKRGRGRPKKFKTSTRITFDLELEQKQALLRLVNEVDGMGISELMRMLVDEHVAEWRMRLFDDPQSVADEQATNV